MKNLIKIVVLLAVTLVILLKFKAVIFGVVLGALASIVYFSLTGSTLNWIRKKK